MHCGPEREARPSALNPGSWPRSSSPCPPSHDPRLPAASATLRKGRLAGLSHCLDRDSPWSLTRVTAESPSPEVTSHRPRVLPGHTSPGGNQRAPITACDTQDPGHQTRRRPCAQRLLKRRCQAFPKMRHETRTKRSHTRSPSDLLPKAAGPEGPGSSAH